MFLSMLLLQKFLLFPSKNVYVEIPFFQIEKKEAHSKWKKNELTARKS